MLAVGNDDQFARFCEVAGKPELATDERFATNPRRVENRETLSGIIAERMETRSCAEWLSVLDAAGVPCGPINSIEQLFDDPQAKARGLRLDIPDIDDCGEPAGGTLPGVASPIRYSETPVRCDLPPPRLGQHTDEVLQKELGMSPAELERVRASGVIGPPFEH